MRRLLKLALVLLPGINARAQSSAIDPSIAKTYFAELDALGKADNGKLWGRSVSGPLMFVDARTRSIVANERDNQELLRPESGVWVGQLPPEINPANTAVNLGGKRWSMVLWPVTDNRYARRILLMHESFHRIQDSLGITGADPSNAHLATAEGRIWTRLEWRALAEALIHTGDSRTRALRDALTFRARRRAQSASAAEDERFLELNEGLAEYTGLVLSGLPRSVLDDRAAIQLSQSESRESFVRSFAYASGPAYALLLDDANYSWRKRLTHNSDLSEMTRRAYRIATINAADADRLVDRYDGARMIAEERSREAARIAREASLTKLFTEEKRLRLPMAGSFSFSFDPNKVTVLSGLGKVYESSRITDAWGVLEVDSGGVLIEQNDKGLITGIIVPKPAVVEGVAKGEGWKLSLASGWVINETGNGELNVANQGRAR
jgi:hypothetical protein